MESKTSTPAEDEKTQVISDEMDTQFYANDDDEETVAILSSDPEETQVR